MVWGILELSWQARSLPYVNWLPVMKSQERHELETNALAKLLASWTEKLGPYSSHIVFGLLAIAAVAAIWQLSRSAWSGRSTEGWDRVTMTLVDQSPDFDSLKLAGEEFSGRPEGQLAKLVVADNELFRASYDFLSDKEQAMKALGAAEKIYNDLASGGSDSLIVERAKLGQARVLELKGKIPEAIETYESLDGLYADLGKERAEYLAKIPAEEYSTWLLEAQGAIPRRPVGLGGGMDFGADPLQMPSGQTEQAPTGPLFGEGPLLDFEAIQENSPEAPEGPRPDRYEEGTGATEAPAGESPPAEPTDPAAPADGAEPANNAPATPGATEPAGETSTDTPAANETEEPAAPEGN